MIRRRTRSEDETRALGEAVSRLAHDGDVVVLGGDLGAGKTRFTQGFARGLGVNEPVTSPTFTLVRSYEGDSMELHHADLYRAEGSDEVADLVLSELQGMGGACVIEWGEPAVALFDGDVLEVRIELGDGDDERVLTLTATGPAWRDRAPELERVTERWRAES